VPGTRSGGYASRSATKGASGKASRAGVAGPSRGTLPGHQQGKNQHGHEQGEPAAVGNLDRIGGEKGEIDAEEDQQAGQRHAKAEIPAHAHDHDIRMVLMAKVPVTAMHRRRRGCSNSGSRGPGRRRRPSRSTHEGM